MATTSNSPLVNAVDELLGYSDETFVDLAYQTILGRHADQAGRTYYLSRLRAGASKLEVITQLRLSKEGRGREVGLSGLDKVVSKYRWARTPFIGRLFSRSSPTAADDASRALRAIENQLSVANRQTQEYLERIDSALQALATRGSARVVPSAESAEPVAATRNVIAAGSTYYCPEQGRSYDLRQEERRHADYLAAIRASGLFDAEFYTQSYPVDDAFNGVPELHYVLLGEEKNWQPSAEFWPDKYLLFNKDVAAAGARPFRHYVETGRFEKRVARPLLQGGPEATPMPTLRQRGFAHPSKIAFCLHVYYVDLWPELASSLKRLAMPFDLFVGLIDRGEPLDEIKREITTSFPDARVFVFPNHGRDVFPFVSMAAAGLFDPYEAVCKIHTKKSPHRVDGDVWRNALIDGVLPKKDAAGLVQRFLANPDWGVLVADGQIYEGEEWWGSNKDRMGPLLHRIELRPSLEHLRFPAGSIFWIKQPLINLIRGMHLGMDDFEEEARQLDGTTAHAFERILGYLGEAAGLDIVETSTVLKANAAPTTTKPAGKKPFVSAFYLPQFHRTPENDEWWGPGYTEWVGASRAKPQFEGQYHPVTPAATGYYDLRDPEVIGEQFKLAKAHGVDAFCVYYYSFDNGRRLLEAPIDNLLGRPDVDACFYLCWANESWTRNWDGMSGEILMSQTYLPDCADSVARDTSRYFADKRYFRLNGTAPRFVIYRPDDIPDLPQFVRDLRAGWAALGFPEVNLGAVLFHTHGDSSAEVAALFDFFIEMPPHGLVPDEGWIVRKDVASHDASFPVRKSFAGWVYSYEHVIKQSIRRQLPAHLGGKVIRGVMPSWDNTARRGNRAHICYGGNPAAFGRWIKGLLDTGAASGELMINSWNEWAEKAMIEPACQYGNGYLDALKRSVGGAVPAAAPVAQPPRAADGKTKPSPSQKPGAGAKKGRAS